MPIGQEEMRPHALCPAHPYLERAITEIGTRHDVEIAKLAGRQERILEIVESSQDKISALALSLGEHRSYHEGKERAENAGVDWGDKGADVLKWLVISIISIGAILILNHSANLIGVFGGK
jgi:hypothetical protein